jgi:hypothetical protein
MWRSEGRWGLKHEHLVNLSRALDMMLLRRNSQVGFFDPCREVQFYHRPRDPSLVLYF